MELVTQHVVSWTEVTETMSIDDVDKLCIARDLIFDAINEPPPKGG